MRPGDALHLGLRFVAKAREIGLGDAGRQAWRRAVGDRAGGSPLARVDRAALFGDPAASRAREARKLRTWSLVDADHVAARYPQAFEREGRTLRYARLPATGASRGLVVLFHGHYAALHLGPVAPLRHFDLLAPWDTFGWRRQGSWFWGERGDDHVARLVAGLVERERRPDRPWFCAGSSMGGFAALYHGITLGCDGIYVQAPQVDLRRKIAEHGAEDRDHPFGHLAGATLESVPDLLAIAERQDALPPLYLVQNLLDPVNEMAAHGFRLLDVYNRKRAWWGARVAPAVGHAADGSLAEAEQLFALLAERRPPRVTPEVRP